LETATIEAYRKCSKKPIAKNIHEKIVLFSEAYQKKRRNLLGHLMRTGNDDPLRQVSLQPNSGRPIAKGKRRSGKPRQRWVDNVMKKVWKKSDTKLPKLIPTNLLRKENSKNP
jgi:hypothetical protein